ncbi:unnamed protein product [Staurois parvus]|uniref:Uncharacterized protein n=1 Tax=Staurois parvus TaxID=386267 RepID=A0ABN9C7N9_9NEOB|nr:unnamed protein product [Staurois parvus]
MGPLCPCPNSKKPQNYLIPENIIKKPAYLQHKHYEGNKVHMQDLPQGRGGMTTHGAPGQ